MRGLKKAVFLDRDGVINRKASEGEYILRDEDLDILPDAPGAIRRLNRAGFLVIVATNQRCVAKGLLTEVELASIHKSMVNRLRGEGAGIDAIYYCPHDGNDDCECRKPKPGMIFRAAEEHAIDLAGSWMIGDDVRDIQAGQAAGCRTICLATLPSEAGEGVLAHETAASLSEAVERLLIRSLN